MILNIRKLLTPVNVLNTIHGGISEPFLSITELAHNREVRIRVPGINTDAFHVEVTNNTLSIFYFIPVLTHEQLIQAPQIVYSKPIPDFIEAGGIKATQEGNDLVVKLPFKELRDGLNRKIEISKG